MKSSLAKATVLFMRLRLKRLGFIFIQLIKKNHTSRKCSQLISYLTGSGWIFFNKVECYVKAYQ